MVLTSTHNLCFEQKYEKYQNFLSENFMFLEVKFSIYLNRRVFVMECDIRTYARTDVVISRRNAVYLSYLRQAGRKKLHVKHYRTFNKKYHNESTALERYVINY